MEKNKKANQSHKGSNDSKKKRPLYRTIYEDQKDKILNGVYVDGEKMPFERELCDEYNVDRITVRRSLDLLVADGLLEKRPGLGSFVKSSITDMLLRQNLSHNILFVMSKNSNDISNNPSAFNSELFYAIERECRSKGYSLFYSMLDNHGDLSSLTNGNSFAGILFVSYVPKQILDQCAQMHLPAICVNNRHESLISIVPEDERGSYEAVKYLQSEGHKKIGILLGREEYYSTQERYRGYKAAMRDMMLDIDAHHVLNGDWTFVSAHNAVFDMIDTLELSQLPTAIFCCSDIMAIGAMDAINEKKLAVPHDISIVGFDNVNQSNYVSPRLTTVSVDVKLMAELAVEKICSFSEGTAIKGYSVLIPAILEKRQSVVSINKSNENWR